ncbi:MAG: translation initiation factor IF-2, partial [Candidatus Micrarchaeota archaeon]
ADLAILVVDINQGFQPQTVESVRILKQYKTPFIIAANKIDVVSGWKSHPTTSFFESLSEQPEHVKNRLDEKLYELVGHISQHGFDSERFDRVTDFTKNIGIVPISAKTKEGLSELLVLIGGLSQKFLGNRLEIDECGRGKGSIIEVKEEKGMGTTIDVILYDGVIRRNDEILFMTAGGIKRSKVRCLLEPGVDGEKYRGVEKVVAAAGVKISAPDLEGAIPGSPMEGIVDFEMDCKTIEKQFKSVIFHKEASGVVLRADSLGSVEALLKLLKDAQIPVKDAAVGNITKKDVLGASVKQEDEPMLSVVLGFNVRVLDEAWEESRSSKVPIIYSDIIYRLVEDYQAWVKEEKERKRKQALESLPWPGRVKILDGYVFRASKPAIFGVDVLSGRVKKGYRLMDKSGTPVGEIREIQKDKEKVLEASAGDQLAVSCDGMTIGKDVNEGDVLYTYMTVDELETWEKQLSMLSPEELELFEQTKRMLRKYF